jgi:NAD(P)-dependent dehydrogenase (short-subunit alcohol dehydrogenase family)
MGVVSGRKALVTGGGRGIGRAIALQLAREGADIAVASRTLDEAGGVAAEARAFGVRAVPIKADVTLEPDVRSMAAAFTRELGDVDILVNCAGGAQSALFVRTDLALWESMLAVNLTSVYLCTAAVLPGMLERGWGRVINVASNAGLVGYAYVTAYCAAKHGVVGLTRALALEVAARGVTVNALCPGYVDTDMTRRSAKKISEKTGVSPEQALDSLAGFNASGRLIQPSEVAAAAMRLVCAEGASLNGQAVPL